MYTAGQKFPDTWILFNFLIKTPIIISKKFLYHIYFIKDTYSYYLRKKKKKKNTNNTIIIKLSFRQKITHEFLSLFLRSVASYLLIYLLFRV